MGETGKNREVASKRKRARERGGERNSVKETGRERKRKGESENEINELENKSA